MLCVHVARLEMPSAHLSRTMCRLECVSGRVFSILKLQLGRLCAPSWEAAFPRGCSGWQGRACQLWGCSGVTLKCPLCRATVPWSELRPPTHTPLAVKSPGCRWAAHILVPFPSAQTFCLPLFISQNKRGNKRERRDQRAVGRPQSEDSGTSFPCSPGSPSWLGWLCPGHTVQTRPDSGI